MSLLSTKIYVPLPALGLVPRPHLIERLDEGLRQGHKLTLVSAPAGFGKTTLLTLWLSRFRDASATFPSVAWLSLDEGDNDPVRFVTYLNAVLQQVSDDAGQDTLGVGKTRSPGSDLEATWATCINHIDATGLRVVLVLDDLHRITSPAIYRLLADLLDHMPRTLHMVIATRVDPPLPIARLRGQGNLTELRQADLGFSDCEVDAYLSQTMGVRLAPDDVAALSARTEGWITGLQMAAFAVQQKSHRPGKKKESISSFLATFTGRHEHIVDYFTDEVLRWQPDHIRAFLLQTSVLEQLCGPLCDAVCDPPAEPKAQQRGQQILEYLQESNLFVVPLDDERRWYRYHHLFADLLRQRLVQWQPEDVHMLHKRASHWYEQNGMLDKAIAHALNGDDLERAACLVEQEAEAVLMRGELLTLTAWLGVLPPDIVDRRPALSLYRATALMLSGEPADKIHPYLQSAAPEGLVGPITQGALILRGLLALWRGDMEGSIALGEQALDSLPEQNLLWRGLVTGNLGIAYMYNGREMDRAAELLHDAANMGERSGSIMIAVIALCNLAELHIVQGQLRTAKKLYDRALALATCDDKQCLPIVGMAAAGLAELKYEWNDLDEAECLLTLALDSASQSLPIWIVDSYLVLSRLRQAQGDGDAALDALDHARTFAANTGATDLDDLMVAATQARLWIASGDLDAASRWAERRGFDVRTKASQQYKSRNHLPRVLIELEDRVLAELWLARKDATRALGLLGALLDESKALQRVDSAIRIHILMALAYQQRGQLEQALASLAQALQASQPGGYVRVFLDQGTHLVRLLRQALAQCLAVERVQCLLESLGPNAHATRKSHRLIEPLSERERQVLRLLTTYRTLAEIGADLYISANTVRFHTKNIYAKLGVHSRKDAVQQARELGLL